MSLINALNVAVSGLTAQSIALGNISDNVANSQTVGFKGTETAFVDYLTESNAYTHTPGAVVAKPNYTNSQEGTITQVNNPTAIAISGGGFFAVQQPTSASTFSPQQYYTRAGDFSPNSSGYLMNSTGYALDGWPVTNGVPNTTALTPIQISTAPSAPVPTANVTIAANLPATPPAGTTNYTTTVPVNDATGATHDLTLNWAQVPSNAGQPISAANPAIPNQWNLTVSGAGSSSAATGPVLVTFGDGTPANAGTITAMSDAANPAAVPAAQGSGSPATVSVGLNFGSGAQAVNLKLGSFGSTTGVTQFSGSTYQVSTQNQDGSAQGNYSSVTVDATGNVIINYDNGRNTTVAQVPLVNFSNADGLQQQNGQAFTGTQQSGTPIIADAGTLGTGKLIVGAQEGSNVDISSEFTQMIVAQRAYTANTKIVSTANQMMQDTLNMVSG